MSRRKQVVEEYFDSAPWDEDWSPRHNIAPTQPIPVIRQNPKVPLTRIDATPNKAVKQWVGKGGDSLRVGFGSIWITDYKRGLLERIPIQQLLTQ